MNNWVSLGTNIKPITVNKDNINIFGSCTISGWAVSGLTLKPMILDFLNAQCPSWSNTNTVSRTNSNSICGNIYTKRTFVQGRIDLLTDGNLTIYMNPTDFDNFIKINKKN